MDPHNIFEYIIQVDEEIVQRSNTFNINKDITCSSCEK